MGIFFFSDNNLYKEDGCDVVKSDFSQKHFRLNQFFHSLSVVGSQKAFTCRKHHSSAWRAAILLDDLSVQTSLCVCVRETEAVHLQQTEAVILEERLGATEKLRKLIRRSSTGNGPGLKPRPDNCVYLEGGEG